MCGIIGIVGQKDEDVVDKLISGLERLEYRGYDSAGMAVVHDEQIVRLRAAGKLKNLKDKIDSDFCGDIGIGHTRWATHGKATENNAHPMMTQDVALVHNGIIENYRELKFELQKDGYTFSTDTDTEVVAVLLQREIDRGLSPREAFKKMLSIIDGSYAFAAVFSMRPDMIAVAKKKSPLVIGLGDNMCAGSDASAISNLCNKVIYLNDGEYAEITRDGVLFFDKNFDPVKKTSVSISDDVINSGKGEYAHFMLKEIMEQSSAIRKTILHNHVDSSILKGVSRIVILACGTSYYAGCVARYWFEKYLRIPTIVEVASEYRYRSPIIEDNTLVFAISQSGETIDTLEAIDYVRKHSNSKVIAIANVKHSAISRVADVVFYTEAGVEIGVASTKVFTAQLSILASLAFTKHDFFLQELQNVPATCEEILQSHDDVKQLAKRIKDAHSAMYLGRGSLYPIALEGALKLKEISYIHAEGFAAGELKHGPIALIDDDVPVICLCPHNEMFEKTASSVEVALARGKNVCTFTDEEGSRLLPKEVARIILPKICSELAPIVYTVPLQLLAYYSALFRGADVDQPRNLAKSVTVE